MLKQVSFRDVPLFVDDLFPYVERIINIALAVGNYSLSLYWGELSIWLSTNQYSYPYRRAVIKEEKNSVEMDEEEVIWKGERMEENIEATDT